jgi:uncharacterized membrane protein YhaH (DUF805 family)
MEFLNNIDNLILCVFSSTLIFGLYLQLCHWILKETTGRHTKLYFFIIILVILLALFITHFALIVMLFIAWTLKGAVAILISFYLLGQISSHQNTKK